MKRFARLLVLSLVLAGLVTPEVAKAQGANDCGQAQPIAGLGLFPFDNTAATIDGPLDCGGQPVRRDVWFAWIAPSSGSYVLSTCNQTTLATRLAVYESLTCPPTLSLGCVDDICGGQTRLPFQAIGGTSYLLRVGSRQIGVSGTGMIELALDPCGAQPDDALEPNDDCASATPTASGSNTGLFISKSDPDYYEFGVQPGATLTVNLVFTHANGDIDTFLFDSCGGTQLAQSASGTNNENLTWTNSGAMCATVKLRVEHWLPDQNADCTNYDMTVSGALACGPPPVIGTPYCQTSMNSAGSGALISAIGSAQLAQQNVTLAADGLPNDVLGLFFMGPSRMQLPFGQGMRCAGGSVHRVQPPVTSGPANGSPAGEVSLPLDFNAPYAQFLAPGIMNFQLWYQDSGFPAFNFTDAVEIVFQ